MIVDIGSGGNGRDLLRQKISLHIGDWEAEVKDFGSVGCH